MVYVNNEYVRKIDELGRIVVPKELRNNLKIQDNENVLITQRDDNICISKYSYLENYSKFLNDICTLFNLIYGYEFVIKDKDNVIYSNYKNIIKISLDSQVIVNSVNIGMISIYGDNVTLTDVKLISGIISIYFTYINVKG